MLRFDSRLIEAAVFVAARRDVRLERELHRRIDPLYTTADARHREASFQAQYAELFVSWRLAATVEALLAEQPTIAQRTARCIVRHAIRAKEETTELFVKSDHGCQERTLLIALRPETLLDSETLGQRLRHELLRVADMLDDRFAYDPAASPVAEFPARTNLLRDRLSVLWDLYIDARLTRRGFLDDGRRNDHAVRLAKTFQRTGPDDGALERTVGRLWQADPLVYADLVRWATAPQTLP